MLRRQGEDGARSLGLADIIINRCINDKQVDK